MELGRFLLLHRLLKQLHSCPVVMMIRVDAEEVPMLTTEFVLLPKALLNKIRALPLDNWGKEHVRAICRAAFHMGELAQQRIIAQVDTLIRLSPWLNGKISVEEAAFQTDVREADVKRMLSTFFELFDVVNAPDVATVA
ncbi:hypothetical protein AAVH_37901 [Aphelenchoides avenae]|nr:hypothetical protein AAVH_37901 [Aphelenchus avenae]